MKKAVRIAKKNSTFFDSTLCRWERTPYHIKTKEGTRSHCTIPFPIPRIHELTLKLELDILVRADILKKHKRQKSG